MKKQFSSAAQAARLAKVLSIDEMPFGSRSDRWWDEFWHYFNLYKTKHIKGAMSKNEDRN